MTGTDGLRQDDLDALIEGLAAALDDTATGLWMGHSGPGWGRVVADAVLPALAPIRVTELLDRADALTSEEKA